MLHQSKQCGTKPCPGRHHCHFLKCRFNLHAPSNTFAIQVYHHHKEPHNVHHCKLYDNALGVTACHCFCWYISKNGQVEGQIPDHGMAYEGGVAMTAEKSAASMARAPQAFTSSS